MSGDPDRVPKIVFGLALGLALFTYGYLSHRFDWFPSGLIRRAELGLQDVQENVVERPWYIRDTPHEQRALVHQREAMQEGLTLVAGIDADNHQFAEVVDAAGRRVHRWSLDWFRIWPEPEHLEEHVVPRSPPGAIVHGMVLTDDGGLIFNYEVLGLVRVDACGHVVWRLPLKTHHSLHRDDDGHLWTSVRHEHHERRAELPNFEPPFYEYTLAEITEDGELLREISLIELFRDAQMPGLLYMATQFDETTRSTGDTLHLNDVEVFTTQLRPGFFQPGDVMISLRRPNAVIVFDLEQRRAKYTTVGGWIRQHDPDFLDGDTISVYDNHYLDEPGGAAQSRIVIESVPGGERKVAFEGTAERPFFSNILGKHAWLPNGNLLLVESISGRVLEVNARGEPVWEFINLVGEGETAVLAEGTRLPPHFTADFFARRRQECAAAGAPEGRTLPVPAPPPRASPVLNEQ